MAEFVPFFWGFTLFGSKKDKLGKIALDPAVFEMQPPGDEEVTKNPKSVGSKLSSSMTSFSPLGGNSQIVIRIVADITMYKDVPGTFPDCDVPLAYVSKKDVAMAGGSVIFA